MYAIDRFVALSRTSSWGVVSCFEERFTTCRSSGFLCELCFDTNVSNFFFCHSLAARATFSCTCPLCSSMIASRCWPTTNSNWRFWKRDLFLVYVTYHSTAECAPTGTAGLPSPLRDGPLGWKLRASWRGCAASTRTDGICGWTRCADEGGSLYSLN